jgi:hypothetical protein
LWWESDQEQRFFGSLVALSAALLGPAHAQVSAFGSDSENRGYTSSFIYTDTVSSTASVGSSTNTGTFSITSGSQITFDSQANNSAPGDPQFITATATFSANAVGAAVLNSDGSYSQAVSNITGSFVTGSSGVTGGNGGHTVLDFAFASGVFNFQAGSGTATFSASASQASNGPGLTDYSSDFFDFNNPNANGNVYESEQFSLAISGINNTSGSGEGPSVGANNTIQSFAGSQTGTFSSNPVPIAGSTNYTAYALPEPSALALTLLGGIAFLPSIRKKKRAK